MKRVRVADGPNIAKSEESWALQLTPSTLRGPPPPAGEDKVHTIFEPSLPQ
jgi:hypothetical protein